MDARTGKKIRLGRLFDQKSHKTLIVAYSHGVLLGPRPGMQSLDEMRRVSLSMGRANGLMVAPGLVTRLEEAFIGRQRPTLIVHLDYQSFSRDILPYEEGAAVEMAKIEEVIAAGADGVMTYLYMGHEDPEKEKLEIERNARLARACERWGIILMIEPRSAREAKNPADKTDPKILAFYCRVSAEIGADLIKCVHPGNEEALRSVIEGSTAPVLVAGGSRAKKAEQAYALAESAMRAGAAGLVYGRNIYEVPDPAAELERYLQIVHT
jgi:DhnA family fructose-bisphosphate aldolase class Ia